MSKRSVFGLVLGAIASIGVGCYSPKINDCEKQCAASIPCPGGMKCQGGFCTSAGRKCATDAGADADEAGDTGMDLPGDLSSELPRDVQTDTEADTPPDVPTDTENDAPPDVSTDMEIDTPPDVSTDMEIDTPPDVSPDMEIDTPPDVPPDMAIDTPPDVSTGGDGSHPDTPDGDGKAPWSPGVIPNLVLWLESDRGIDAPPGGKIPEWRDQSGLHNDAKQTTALFAPTLATGPFSGMPGVEFATKAWMTIADDVSLRAGVLDFLVLVVYRATAGCEGNCILQQLYRKQQVAEPWTGIGLGLQPGGKVEVHLDHYLPNHWLTSPLAGYDSGRIHLVGAQRRSAWPSVRVDGSDFPSSQPSVVVNLDAPGANVYFGAHGLNPDPYIDFPFRGYIGAIVAVQGAISAGDLAQLESYLMVKYGVAPDGPP